MNVGYLGRRTALGKGGEWGCLTSSPVRSIRALVSCLMELGGGCHGRGENSKALARDVSTLKIIEFLSAYPGSVMGAHFL